jgi:hypothetical protein
VRGKVFVKKYQFGAREGRLVLGQPVVAVIVVVCYYWLLFLLLS